MLCSLIKHSSKLKYLKQQLGTEYQCFSSPSHLNCPDKLHLKKKIIGCFCILKSTFCLGLNALLSLIRCFPKSSFFKVPFKLKNTSSVKLLLIRKYFDFSSLSFALVERLPFSTISARHGADFELLVVSGLNNEKCHQTLW